MRSLRAAALPATICHTIIPVQNNNHAQSFPTISHVPPLRRRSPDRKPFGSLHTLNDGEPVRPSEQRIPPRSSPPSGYGVDRLRILSHLRPAEGSASTHRRSPTCRRLPRADKPQTKASNGSERAHQQQPLRFLFREQIHPSSGFGIIGLFDRRRFGVTLQWHGSQQPTSFNSYTPYLDISSETLAHFPDEGASERGEQLRTVSGGAGARISLDGDTLSSSCSDAERETEISPSNSYTQRL